MTMPYLHTATYDYGYEHNYSRLDDDQDWNLMARVDPDIVDCDWAEEVHLGLSLEHVPEDERGDLGMCLEAVERDADELEFVPDEILLDAYFVKECMLFFDARDRPYLARRVGNEAVIREAGRMYREETQH